MRHLKLFINMFVLMGMVTACSCGSSQATPTPAQPAEVSWEEVQGAGKLLVGISPDYPPFEFYNPQYQFDGFDIALINEVARQLGVSVEFMPFAFDGLLPTVQLGQVDVAISAISVTPERQAVVDFSNVYYATTDAVLVRSDSTLSPQTPDLLVNTRLGVQQGSVYQGYAQTRLVDTGKMPSKNLLVYSDINQAVTDVKESRIEAVWLGLLPAQEYAKDGSVKIATQALNQQLLGIAVKKGSTGLLNKLNEALLALQNNGTIARLSEQYLNETSEENVTPIPTPTVAPSQPTPTPLPCMDSAGLVKHLSYDDKNMTQPAVMAPGEAFTKGWEMINNGTCAWTTGYKLVFSTGNEPAAQMGGQPIPVTKEVKPGETFDFQVNLIAPDTPGTYQALWNMQNAQAMKFGVTVSVGIVVAAAPTQTPSPNIEFNAKPTDILAGETVLFTWKTSNVKAVYFYHEGQDWEDHQVDLSGEDEEDPEITLTYYLRVINPDNSETKKKITINVTQPAGAPVIEKFDAEPDEIMLGECVDLEWKVTGQVDYVSLYLDESEIWPNAPLSGGLDQNCPPASGEAKYKLVASGPGGSVEDKAKVNVIEQQQPPTPTPFEPVQDPAAAYCVEQRGTLATQTRGDGNEYGVCLFEENRQCEEWAMYNGDCPVGGVKVSGYATPAAVYCAITGGTYAATGNQGAADEQGTCTFNNGQVCDVWELYNGMCSP